MKKALIFGGLLVLAGIALIVAWESKNIAASRGEGWTQVVGRVETVSVKEGAFLLAYRYEVAGRAYRNPNGRLTMGRTPADRYAPGGPVLAYFNPKAPQESLLEAQPAPPPTLLIAGVILIVAGIPIGFYFVSEEKARRRRLSAKHTSRRSMSRLKPPSIPRRPPTS